MMKVIGEEGTAIEDFVTYLKSEFLDYVFLQQNTFDEVDGATGADRQKYMFNKVVDVLKTDFEFKEDKDFARRYFLELRQLFVDSNYMKMESSEFKEQEKLIADKISQCAIGA